MEAPMTAAHHERECGTRRCREPSRDQLRPTKLQSTWACMNKWWMFATVSMGMGSCLLLWLSHVLLISHAFLKIMLFLLFVHYSSSKAIRRLQWSKQAKEGGGLCVRWSWGYVRLRGELCPVGWETTVRIVVAIYPFYLVDIYFNSKQNVEGIDKKILRYVWN